MLDIVPHPHHQSLENCLLVWNVDVIAGEQLNNLRRGEQEKLLILNDLQEVFLEQRGDTEETDNHQLLAEEVHSVQLCVNECVCVCLYEDQVEQGHRGEEKWVQEIGGYLGSIFMKW